MTTRRTGQKLGDYEIISELGRGGMSDVYRVYNHRKSRSEALKVLRVQAATAEDASRFQREIAITTKLTHPNIVAVYDAGVMKEEGVYYIAMEAMEGTLRDYLKAQRNGHLKLEETAQIIAALAEALDYAHKQKVIHRDIKPENVLYQTDANRERRWCLADFGIARAADDSHLTRAGEAVGTVAYMAPERFSDVAAPGPASDQYSLGVVLYEMLTGAPPFTGAPEDVMRAQLEMRPDAPSKRVNSLPREVDDIVLRMLAKRPRDRYPNTTAAAADLQAAAGMLPDDALRKMYARAASLSTEADAASLSTARTLMETIREAAPNFRDRQKVMQKVEEREQAIADGSLSPNDVPTKKTIPARAAPLVADANSWPGHLFPTRKSELSREVQLAAGSTTDGTVFGTRVRIGKEATLRGHVYSSGDVVLEDGATVTGTIIARGRLEIAANCRARSVFAAFISIGQHSQVRRWAISEAEMAIGANAQVGGAHALGPLSLERAAQVMSPSVVSAHDAVTIAPEVQVGESAVTDDNSFALDRSGKLRARLGSVEAQGHNGMIVTSLLNHRLLRAIAHAKSLIGAEPSPAAAKLLDDSARPSTTALPIVADDETTIPEAANAATGELLPTDLITDKSEKSDEA